jgi:hypothetical protein
MIAARIGIVVGILAWGILSAIPEINLTGVVTDGTNPVAGASVSLVNYPQEQTSTNDKGEFTLTKAVGIRTPRDIAIGADPSFGVTGAALTFFLPFGIQQGRVVFIAADGCRAAVVPLGALGGGRHHIGLPQLSPGLYFVQFAVDNSTTAMQLLNTGNGFHIKKNNRASTYHSRKQQAVMSASPVDELVIEKSGYVTKKVSVTSYTEKDIAVVLEVATTQCEEFKIPAIAELKENKALPDPFKFIDGTRISKKSQWPCLREQLKALLYYSQGSLPKDPGTVTATYSGGKLNISVAANGKEASFSVTIKNVPNGEGPHPAIITLGGATIASPAGIAEISYPHNTVAQEKSRSGVFSTLYGTNSGAGSMVMWAWGVGRVIDALEQTEGHHIDPTRLGVTGCSRNGKGAMVCGAYEERIALVLPMEGGSGGISSWRIAKVENSNKSAHPDGCQTASQIIGESGWLAPQFDQFAKEQVSLDKLPTDAHTLAAICAPRGLFMVEGSQNSWNCNAANWTAAYAARMVYQALGVEENMGHVMTNHNHCSGYSSAEKEAYAAFCKKFLLGDESVNTDEYFYNDGSFDDLLDYDKWIDWEAPELE